MNKLMLTMAFAISLLIAMPMSHAQSGGLFGRGQEMPNADEMIETQSLYNGGTRSGDLIPELPSSHGFTNNSTAPLGSGMAVLFGMAVAFLIIRHKKTIIKKDEKKV